MFSLTKPTDQSGRQFEHMCLVILERCFEAPFANFYGRKGLGQNGIDIRMMSTKGGTKRLVVVQCKHWTEVHWSNFADDFKAAVKAFAPRHMDDPDLLFILATTAEGVNTADIDEKARLALAELHEQDKTLDIKRVTHDEFVWPRLEVEVQKDRALRTFFCSPDWAADKESSKNLDELEKAVSTARASSDLRAARSSLEAYRRSVRKGLKDFKWVRTWLMEDLATVFLRAGDFESTLALLDVALGLYPHNAMYLLGHLRALRVLGAFPCDDRPFQFAGLPPLSNPAPEGLRPVPDEVDANAQDLLTALGSVDQQLTLTLWVISYTGKPDVADQALRRAFGLLTQAWPNSIERLQPEQNYTVSPSGYLSVENAFEQSSVTSPYDRRYACGLVVAYSYIRLVHACRYDEKTTKKLEAELGGWPRIINGLTGKEMMSFFSTNLQPQVLKTLQHFFPSLYSEGRGREFDWPIYPEFVARNRPILDRRSYACSAEFLLRDCADQLIERRFKELDNARFPGRGTTLVTTHLSLERIAQVQRGRQIALESEDDYALNVRSMLDQIDEVIRNTMRIESGDRRAGHSRVIAFPCYYPPADPGAPIDPNLELVAEKEIDFIAASDRELIRAENRLPWPEDIIRYWIPPMNRIGLPGP